MGKCGGPLCIAALATVRTGVPIKYNNIITNYVFKNRRERAHPPKTIAIYTQCIAAERY